MPGHRYMGMNTSSLDSMIRRVRERPVPPCPSDLEDRVLRDIRRNPVNAPEVYPVLQPAFSLTAVAAAVVIGVAVSLFATGVREGITRQDRSRAALDFQVLHDNELIAFQPTEKP